MRSSLDDPGKSGGLAVKISFLVWVLFSATISVKLFLEGRYFSGTGVAIITAVLVFFLMLSLITPKEEKLRQCEVRKEFSRTNTGSDADLVLLFSTKDYLKAHQIEQTLQGEGIYCIILDEHGTLMMSFLPGIEMRVMVQRKDFNRSAEKIREMLE